MTTPTSLEDQVAQLTAQTTALLDALSVRADQIQSVLGVDHAAAIAACANNMASIVTAIDHATTATADAQATAADRQAVADDKATVLTSLQTINQILQTIQQDLVVAGQKADSATASANTATTQAGTATTQATAAATTLQAVQGIATNLTSLLATFRQFMLGAFATDAAAAAFAAGQGISLYDGIMYENTAGPKNKFRFYDGAAWQDYDSTAQTLQNQAQLSATQAAGYKADTQTLHDQTATLLSTAQSVEAQTQTLHDQTQAIHDQTATLLTQTQTVEAQTQTLHDQVAQLEAQTQTLHDQASASATAAANSASSMTGALNINVTQSNTPAQQATGRSNLGLGDVSTHAAADFILATQKGAASGVAPLDSNSLIPAAYLPSFVDDVLEFATKAAFPATGETGKIYTAINSGTASDPSRIYRWSGSVYIELEPSPGSTDAVPEGSVNVYFTRLRALSALLTEYAAGTASTVTPADTVLTAIIKLQAQITALNSAAFKMTTFKFTATANQTTFTGADDNGATLAYKIAACIITLNGAVIDIGVDVTASNGTSAVLASAASAGDVIKIHSFGA